MNRAYSALKQNGRTLTAGVPNTHTSMAPPPRVLRWRKMTWLHIPAIVFMIVMTQIPAAYCMVFQLRKKSSNDMLFFVLSTRFMPFAAILIPLYVIVSRLNLLDNLLTLIIVYTAMNLPLIIWMARSYFLDLPKEVLECAWLDGCNTLRTIAHAWRCWDIGTRI